MVKLSLGILAATLALAPSTSDACALVYDTYYTATTTAPVDRDQCDWASGPAAICNISLKGVKRVAAGANPPVVVFNHGSQQNVDTSDTSMFCELSDFFVANGWSVYMPLRRGHQTMNGSTVHKSSGTHYAAMTTGRDVDNLLKQKLDVQLAVQHVDRWNGTLFTTFVLMGNSFGAQVSLFANSIPMGQRAVIAMSAGGKSWSNDADPNVDANGDGDKTNDPDVPNTYFQSVLKQWVRYGIAPVFFLQAKWDHDTGPTVELAREFANSGLGGQVNARVYESAIWDYSKAGDPQETHENFPRKTNLWGANVLAFIARAGGSVFEP